MFHLRISSLATVFFITLLIPCFAQTTETIQIDTYYPAPYGVYAELTTTSNTYLATEGGNVGIGTTSPDILSKLEISGKIKIRDGSEKAGRVLVSDTTGLATWKQDWIFRGSCSATLGSTCSVPGATYMINSGFFIAENGDHDSEFGCKVYNQGTSSVYGKAFYISDVNWMQCDFLGFY